MRPPPSGPLHFGSLIAALGSLLEARSRGGQWQVRIDDLDTPRVVPGAADDILHTLECYGMGWDGPVRYQSQHVDAYQAALQQLLDRDLAYSCTCSRREIADIAIIGPSGMIYPGTCRHGVSHPGRQASIRLRTDAHSIGFHDSIQGFCEQDLQSQVGDFVIRRADGLFAYQLAVVIDDAAQGITQIVRGNDLLESTARQIHLQQLLNLPTPRYSHLPLAVDQHGHKLSKQTQAPALDRRAPRPHADRRPGISPAGPASGVGAGGIGNDLGLGLRSLATQADTGRTRYALGTGNFPGKAISKTAPGA